MHVMYRLIFEKTVLSNGNWSESCRYTIWRPGQLFWDIAIRYISKSFRCNFRRQELFGAIFDTAALRPILRLFVQSFSGCARDIPVGRRCAHSAELNRIVVEPSVSSGRFRHTTPSQLLLACAQSSVRIFRLVSGLHPVRLSWSRSTKAVR